MTKIFLPNGGEFNGDESLNEPLVRPAISWEKTWHWRYQSNSYNDAGSNLTVFPTQYPRNLQQGPLNGPLNLSI